VFAVGHRQAELGDNTMKTISAHSAQKAMGDKCRGFTLLELMIAIFVSLIFIGLVYSAYAVSQKTYMHQRLISDVQQNVRGTMLMLQSYLRLAGSEGAANPIASVALLDINGNQSTNGFPSITISGDFDLDSNMDTAVFRLYDFMGDGINDMGLNLNGGGTQLLAEGIQAIGLAYAIDSNADGLLDTIDTVNNNLIWAIDSNNDGLLDTNLDTNNDGVIDRNDDSDGDGFITSSDGTNGALNPQVSLDAIRLVQIWVLGQSQRQEPRGILDANHFYVVGHRVVPNPANNPNGFNDRFRRRLMTSVVFCRNL